MNDMYELLSPDECYSKNYGDYFETYKSHINVSLSFVKPVMSIFKSKYPFEYIKNMVELHDIGKRGIEFQDKIKGSKPEQYIRHEYLAFIKWLDGNSEIKNLDLPQILAILMHHQTIIDDEISAVSIERYITEHPKMEVLAKRWLEILKTPREKRIDKTFLEALKLVDVLRTIDILASYTTETVFARSLDQNYKSSLYEGAFTNMSKELSSINLKVDEIEFEKIYQDNENIKIHIIEPIDCIVEYTRGNNK